jgi:16S rRNA (guanine527-N7)-methyltransferase
MIIKKYFPDLDDQKLYLFEQVYDLYADWNTKINLISRKDIDHLMERHILHSLSIAKVIQFKPNTRILDIGTGGGFPGIPLAIMFPDAHFRLVDSIGKKIKVVKDIATQLDLNNVVAEQSRAENVRGHFDFIVSRALTNLPEIVAWTRGKIFKKNMNLLPNGILYIKGGEVLDEVVSTGKKYHIFEMHKFFREPFFETKKLIHLY